MRRACRPRLEHTLKNCKWFQTLIQRYAKFWFLEMGLGLVPLPYFVHDFSTKIFLILYFIKRARFMVWLPLPPEVLSNICIIICCPFYDVINFEINVLGRRQIVFVTLSDVLVAKVSNPSLNFSDLHTMVNENLCKQTPCTYEISYFDHFFRNYST